MNSTHHLVQANIARGLAEVTDPIMQGFVDQLDHINALAESAPGFVCRLQTDDGDATALRMFDDPRIIVNMSMWESVETLFEFTFRSDHLGLLQDRKRWFAKMGRAHSVLWWVSAGERPSPEELKVRLEGLHERGPTPAAFTFSNIFDPFGAPVDRQAGLNR